MQETWRENAIMVHRLRMLIGIAEQAGKLRGDQQIQVEVDRVNAAIADGRIVCHVRLARRVTEADVVAASGRDGDWFSPDERLQAFRDINAQYDANRGGTE